ncbi:MAG: hypothetical protein WBO43_08560 [Gemmatimonadota bacterium]|jgi:hypothetical protein
MRWRIPIAVLLVAGLVVACDQGPTEAADSTADVPAIQADNGAVRWIPDPECGVFDGDGEFFLVDCRNQIATYSNNGNALVVVQASGVPNPTGEMLQWDAYNPPQIMLDWFGLTDPPVPCYVLGPDGGALFTLNWKAKLTPSGQGSFVCHYKEQWEYQWPD